jgi:polyhydroxybutyrate depolymerase
MKLKRIVITITAFVIGIPMLLILTGIGWYLYSDRTNGSIVSSGKTRDYLLYVPESYDPTRPASLVISMHGTALWPALQRNISNWNDVADEHGFIVVYPGAMGRPQRKWQLSFSPGPGDRLEVHFISDLIDSLEEAYNIDPSRIYIDGLSAGGIMALAVGCLLPNRIAAIAAVVAALPNDYCDDPRPIPLVTFHGTADPIYPYEGGATWAVSEPVESVSSWVSKRARQNECAPIPAEVRVSADVLRQDYRDCTSSLVHYIVDGGGHQWPGGKQFPEWMAGPAVKDIDATRIIWRFFSQHQLNQSSGSVPVDDR